MRFDWDEDKNESNLAKHGLRFETAKLVFQDWYVLEAKDRVVEGELRWQALGEVLGAVVLVAYTLRGDA